MIAAGPEIPIGRAPSGAVGRWRSERAKGPDGGFVVTRPTGRWMDGIAYEHRACRDGALGGSSGQLEPDRSVWVRGLDAWYRLPQRRRVVQAQEKGAGLARVGPRGSTAGIDLIS